MPLQAFTALSSVLPSTILKASGDNESCGEIKTSICILIPADCAFCNASFKIALTTG